MKLFAEFYEKRNGEWVNPCGSFSVIAIDGRLNLENAKGVAAEHCGKRKYGAYRVFRGDFRQSSPATPIIELAKEAA